MSGKPKSACLKERPTTPIENILIREEGGWDLCTKLQEESRPPESWQEMTLEKFLVFHLGKEDFQWTGEFRFRVWERPLYRLLVNNKKGLCLEVPEDSTYEQALDALEQFRKDHGISKSILSGSEIEKIQQLGKKAVGDRRYPIPKTSEEDLKKFVLRYCDGGIITDRDIQNRTDVTSVFMVLALGGLEMPEEDRAVIFQDNDFWNSGEKPSAPKKPAEPDELKKPDRPEEPAAIKVDPEKLDQIEYQMAWGLTHKKAKKEYQEEIKNQNSAQEKKYKETVQSWEKDCEKIEIQQQEQNVKYQQELMLWETECCKLSDEINSWNLKNERRKVFERAVSSLYYSDLGCVWEDISKAGPMSINGLPMFMSLRIMHKADWERIVPAIQKEFDRRENFSI